MKSNELRRLKIKLANLQVEIQRLLDKGEREPGLIDAIASDIAAFTDEVTKISQEIETLKSKNESISLFNLYNEIKNNK